jgi:RPA family protein
MKQRLVVAALGFGLSAALLAAAAHADGQDYRLVIREHRFVPTELTVPAGQKVKLVVVNEDATPEEFESYELNREKVVPPKGSVVVFVGPLKPGRYEFFGEFNQATARGWLIAR